MLTLKRSTPFLRTSTSTSPLQAWRAAAHLVWARWEVLLEAPPEARSRAYAAYHAALDAEAEAAAIMARTALPTGA